LLLSYSQTYWNFGEAGVESKAKKTHLTIEKNFRAQVQEYGNLGLLGVNVVGEGVNEAVELNCVQQAIGAGVWEQCDWGGEA